MIVTLLGSGAWGTGIAKLFALKGHQVKMYGVDESGYEINTKHINTKYFPDVVLPECITFTMDLSQALEGSEIVVFSIPSIAYDETAKKVASLLKGKVHIVSSAKGFDPNTNERLSSVLRREIPEEKRYPIVTLIGPSYAEEVVHDMLTSVSAVSLDIEEAKFIQERISSERFRVYTNTDEIGAECSAALKNVIAIGAGILSGMNQGENAKAALVTRGIAEMMRLGIAMGGRKETYLGLTGIGDLMLTCNSMKSRNFSLGYEIGRLNDAKEPLRKNTKTVEGVNTSKYAIRIAEQLHVDMPITTAIYRTLFEGQTPTEMVREVMLRSLKSES